MARLHKKTSVRSFSNLSLRSLFLPAVTLLVLVANQGKAETCPVLVSSFGDYLINSPRIVKLLSRSGMQMNRGVLLPAASSWDREDRDESVMPLFASSPNIPSCGFITKRRTKEVYLPAGLQMFVSEVSTLDQGARVRMALRSLNGGPLVINGVRVEAVECATFAGFGGRPYLRPYLNPASPFRFCRED